jgi:ornithine cyclodeaminase
LASADVVVADSLEQCLESGEIQHAVAAQLLDPADFVELGDVLTGRALGRTADQQITVADLTGVGVQDVAVVNVVVGRTE